MEHFTHPSDKKNDDIMKPFLNSASIGLALPDRANKKKTLITLNAVMFALHLISTIVVLSLNSVNNIRYCIPLYITYPKWHVPNPNVACFSTYMSMGVKVVNQCSIELSSDKVSVMEGTTLLALFTLVSALFHAIIVYKNEWYVKQIEIGNQWLRWVEYSFSSAIMIIVILAVVGVNDLYTVMFSFTAMWSVNMLGYSQEILDQFAGPVANRQRVSPRINNLNASVIVAPEQRNWFVRYHPTFIGWVIYIVLWAVVLTQFFYSYFNSDVTPPEFVIAAVFTLLILFSSFGVVQLLTIAGKLSYYTGEITYVVLSLVAKLSLVWILQLSMFNTANITIGNC